MKIMINNAKITMILKESLIILDLFKNISVLTYRFKTARCERISNISLITCAGGNVVDYTALGIDATEAGAGIHTLQLLACFVRRAFSIDGALGSTCYIRVSKVLRNTHACCGSISVGATCILSTRGGIAGIWCLGGNSRR